MTADKQKIAEEIIALERSFNERFSIGDSSGYLDKFHEDVSYFDTVGDRLGSGLVKSKPEDDGCGDAYA